jgi:hypothetical protein
MVRCRADLSKIAVELTTMMPSNAILAGRLGGTLALLGPLEGVSFLDEVSYSRLANLTNSGPVWFLLLEGDEWRVIGDVWPFLIPVCDFPVNYDRYSKTLHIYQLVTSGRDFPMND